MSDTIQGLRKEKLIALLKEWKDSGKFSSVAAVCRHYPVDASYISQIKSGHRGFGEDAARKLEVALELPKFYFEPSDPTQAMKASNDGFANARRVTDKPIRYAPFLILCKLVCFANITMMLSLTSLNLLLARDLVKMLTGWC
nr:hypothetical protein [Psychrobacter sp. PraFG1]UNK06636.1 hypothetical protein MN210_11085 [Psychrobacter sp. PraFG1]